MSRRGWIVAGVASVAVLTVVGYENEYHLTLDDVLRGTQRDMLISDDGTLNTAVNPYFDCDRVPDAPMPTEPTVIACFPGPIQIIGDRKFAPLRNMSENATLTYYDPFGVPHRWMVVDVHHNWMPGDGPADPYSASVVAQLMTCERNCDGFRILDVVRL